MPSPVAPVTAGPGLSTMPAPLPLPSPCLAALCSFLISLLCATPLAPSSLPASHLMHDYRSSMHSAQRQAFYENANDLRQCPLGRHSIRPVSRTCLPRGRFCMPPLTGRCCSSGGLWRLHGKQQLRVGRQHSSYTLISVHGQQRSEEGVQEGAKIAWKQLGAPLLQVSLCRQALACNGARR